MHPPYSPSMDILPVQTGEGMGVLRDRISGLEATVARAGSPNGKTIVLPGPRIVDVPANTLAVRPRWDGKPGYEASFEELRQNYLLNSQPSAFTAGMPDSWTQSIIGTPGVTRSQTTGPYSSAARMACTNSGPIWTVSDLQKTLAGTFQSGWWVSCSAWYRLINAGANCYFSPYSLAYDVADSYIAGSGISASAGYATEWTRLTWTMQCPAGTDHVGIVMRLQGAAGQNATLEWACPQLELGAYPSGYIPTTTSVAARQLDWVTIPSTPLTSAAGSIVTVFGEQPVYGGTRRIIGWQRNSDNIILLYTSDGTYGTGYGNFRESATSYYGYGNARAVPWDNGSLGMAWDAGNAPTECYIDTTGKGASAGGVPPADLTGLDAYLYLGATGSQANGGFIKRFTWWPTKLTDAQMAEMLSAMKEPVSAPASRFIRLGAM